MQKLIARIASSWVEKVEETPRNGVKTSSTLYYAFAGQCHESPVNMSSMNPIRIVLRPKPGNPWSGTTSHLPYLAHIFEMYTTKDCFVCDTIVLLTCACSFQYFQA